MIEPKEILIKTQSGVEKVYIISKFPAIQGREIIAKYPLSAMPKVGDYSVNEETMLKLMSFVAVPCESGHLRLSTKELVNNHCPDWETLARIEMAMIEYNCSFFQNGIPSAFLNRIKERIPEVASKILTQFSRSSSKAEKQHFKS